MNEQEWNLRARGFLVELRGILNQPEEYQVTYAGEIIEGLDEDKLTIDIYKNCWGTHLVHCSLSYDDNYSTGEMTDMRLHRVTVGKTKVWKLIEPWRRYNGFE